MPNELGARAAVVVREEIACLASRRSLVTVIGRQSVAPTGPARPVTDLSSKRDWHPISGTRFGVYPRCNRPSAAHAAGFSHLHVGIGRRGSQKQNENKPTSLLRSRNRPQTPASKAYWLNTVPPLYSLGIRNLPERNKFRSLFQKHPKCHTTLLESKYLSRGYFWNLSHAYDIGETP